MAPPDQPLGSSVESFCNLLVRSSLFTPAEVRALLQRWRGDAQGTAADAEHFSQWLIAQQHLTAYQVNMLCGGHADRLFLNDYKLVDRIGQGRMAGVFKAVHRLGQVVAI